MPIEPKRVSEDEFMMWRAVFAFALVDHDLNIEKQKILTHHMSTRPFSADQMVILRDDMKSPQDVEELYGQISVQKFKEKFCALARTLVWCDGDIDLQEKRILQNVGCFKTRDALNMLRESTKHDLYKKFTKIYEQTSQLKNTQAAPIFALAA